ncbi:PP2C family protein-serine/threonine phosphatase [Paraliobacillus sediminis]|uniref:PP2C family protein-serine/threonine phosphatase n=1 Tax=Paraliobacillus sediminis TaxID=1885916 RepID=UPI000E3BAEAA|nr:protein phosphatase 2C domain-containing protein [Paraliobacillus sediminis]
MLNRVKNAWEYGLATDCGPVRQVNEDQAFLRIFTDPNADQLMLVMVADGMGGYQGGEVASRMVIDQINRWFTNNIDRIFSSTHPFLTLRIELNKLLIELNQEVIDYGKRNGKQLGTTLSLLLLYKGRSLLAHVGDSRIYQLEHVTKCSNYLQTERIYQADEETEALEGETTLRQLTEDHTWVNRQVREGKLSRQAARTHPKRNVLVQCLGIENHLDPFFAENSYQVGDFFLLCSDGFHELFSDESILTLVEHYQNNQHDLQTFTEELIRVANQTGATDNITLVIIKPVATKVKRKKRMVRLFL